jgi:hypothetical protein
MLLLLAGIQNKNFGPPTMLTFCAFTGHSLSWPLVWSNCVESGLSEYGGGKGPHQAY